MTFHFIIVLVYLFSIIFKGRSVKWTQTGWWTQTGELTLPTYSLLYSTYSLVEELNLSLENVCNICLLKGLQNGSKIKSQSEEPDCGPSVLRFVLTAPSND